MIKFIFGKIKDILFSRLFWISIVYSILAFILLQRMFELQIVEKEETPEKTEYLYYLWDRVDNDGHIFSKTYQEHLNHSKRLGY